MRRQHDIDANALRDLTDADLEKIGVTLGHRKRVLRAIAELDKAAMSAESVLPDEAQRRHLTVMFCDLVGSTVLSTRLDPEDLREVIGNYHKAVAEEVGGFGGFVAKYMRAGRLPGRTPLRIGYLSLYSRNAGVTPSKATASNPSPL